MMIEILHMTSGQVVVADCSESFAFDPFEIFVTLAKESAPDANKGAVQVTLAPFGVLFGLLPCVSSFRITDHSVVVRFPAPAEFAERYSEFRKKHIDAMTAGKAFKYEVVGN